jgi:prevent-host-death family protein
MVSDMVICYPSGMVKTMSATQFKAKCLGILDEVGEGAEVIITKRGKPVAKLVPVAARARKSTRGILKGKVWITGDIVNTDWSDLFDVLKE